MKLVSRRQEYRETLREDILDAARQLFVRDGYEATSMRAIAAKVGCSPGILYHYFADKQAIMARLVEETFCLMRQRLNAIREDKAPPQDRLRRGLRAYIDFGLEHPHHYGLLFMTPHDLESQPDLLKVFMNDGMQTFGCLRSMCKECIELGVFRTELHDEDEVAQSLWVSIHGLLSLQIQAKTFPWVERTRLIERLVDVLYQGVAR
jgi:AcrR family transcriptional regulator